MQAIQDRKSEAKIIEQINQADNILIAINKNPTIDQLVAALGLTLALNKNDKRATTIFSGQTPGPIKFLKPEESFDTDVNGLRDFIVALDTKKADYVKTKVVDDMVRILITPAKKAISADDLQFTQGEYNVDLVLALGVAKKADLDQTLAAHGKILHNAFVASISVDQDNSQLGTINWQEPEFCAYSQISYQLLANMDLLDDEDSEEEMEEWVDKAVATAFMTGLVDVTDRFSNEKTSAEVMKVASELMNKGANQQLIATELERAKEESVAKSISKPTPEPEKPTKQVVEEKPLESKLNLSKKDSKKTKSQSETTVSTVEAPVVEAPAAEVTPESTESVAKEQSVEQKLDQLIANNQSETKPKLEKADLEPAKEQEKLESKEEQKEPDSFDLTARLEAAEKKIAERKAKKAAELKKQLLETKPELEIKPKEDDKKQEVDQAVDDKEKQPKKKIGKNKKKSKKVIAPPVHQPGEKTNLAAEINKELGIDVPQMPKFDQPAPPAPPAPPIEAPTLAAAPPQQEAPNPKITDNSFNQSSMPPLPPPPPMPDFSKMPPLPPQPPQMPNHPAPGPAPSQAPTPAPVSAPTPTPAPTPMPMPTTPTAPKAKKPEDDEFVIPI